MKVKIEVEVDIELDDLIAFLKSRGWTQNDAISNEIKEDFPEYNCIWYSRNIGESALDVCVPILEHLDPQDSPAEAMRRFINRVASLSNMSPKDLVEECLKLACRKY